MCNIMYIVSAGVGLPSILVQEVWNLRRRKRAKILKHFLFLRVLTNKDKATE